MGATITIQLPREVLHATRLTSDELRVELAIHLFEQGKLSFGKAREMAALDAWTFQQILGSRAIPVHYGPDEYAEDLATLQEITS
jgi:predicted HTH domain antitoxin